MNLLLDTHALLWYAWDDSRLSNVAANAIEAPDNKVYISIVSLWEITIKNSLGKLTLELPLAEFFAKNLEGNGFSSSADQTFPFIDSTEFAVSSPRPVRPLAHCPERI